jgi:hypothetical protein
MKADDYAIKADSYNVSLPDPASVYQTDIKNPLKSRASVFANA